MDDALTRDRHPSEPLIEWVGATALGGAVGFALLQLAPAGLPGLGGPPVAAMGALAAMGAGWAMLRRVAERDGHRLPGLAVPTWPAFVETQAGAEQGGDGDELLLEDRIAPVDDNSRVVRLFDQRAVAVPTAGQLAARIDRHLAQEPAVPVADAPAGRVVALPPVPPRDAHADLHAALAELRASLQRG